MLDELVAEVRRAFGAPGLNPESRTDLMGALRRAGVEVPDIRASTLRQVDHPAIEPLLRYKKLAHLFQANGWTWLDEWVSDGRFRPSYQPAGSSTGRWSSNGGGALSFPVQVRSAAVADEGWVLVVADVAQLEPRVLAGMSRDGALARAAEGADLYQGMVADGAVATRQDAKLGLLGAMYGATSGESGRMVAGLTRRYPAAFALVDEAARAGERGQVVRTLLGRGSPSLGGSWQEEPDEPPSDLQALDRRRRAYGRFTRNFVVQGTGAEWALCWIADLRNRLWRLGGTGALDQRPHLVLFLHDEVVVHTPVALADQVAAELEQAAAARGTTALPRLRRGLPAEHRRGLVLRRCRQGQGQGRDLGPPRRRHSPLRSSGGAAAGWWWRQEATGEHHDRARHDGAPSARPARARRAVRRFVGGFYLVMGGINAGIALADAETYRTFADGSFWSFVADAWQHVVMAHPVSWILLLAAGEVVLGLLLLRGGPAARPGGRACSSSTSCSCRSDSASGCGASRC